MPCSDSATNSQGLLSVEQGAGDCQGPQDEALGRGMAILLANNSVGGCNKPVVMTCDKKPTPAQRAWAVISGCWLGNPCSNGENKDSSSHP